MGANLLDSNQWGRDHHFQKFYAMRYSRSSRLIGCWLFKGKVDAWPVGSVTVSWLPARTHFQFFQDEKKMISESALGPFSISQHFPARLVYKITLGVLALTKLTNLHDQSKRMNNWNRLTWLSKDFRLVNSSRLINRMIIPNWNIYPHSVARYTTYVNKTFVSTAQTYKFQTHSTLF